MAGGLFGLFACGFRASYSKFGYIMSRIRLILAALFLALTTLVPILGASPNIVLIFADDLAYADELGFNIAFLAERHYLQSYRCQASSVWIGAASQRTKS